MTPVPEGVGAARAAPVTAREFVISDDEAGSSPSLVSSRKPWSTTERWSNEAGSPFPSV
jgi:hypothetical protein